MFQEKWYSKYQFIILLSSKMCASTVPALISCNYTYTVIEKNGGGKIVIFREAN